MRSRLGIGGPISDLLVATVCSAFEVCLVLGEGRRQLSTDLGSKDWSHDSHDARDGRSQPSLHDRSILTVGFDSEGDGTAGELTCDDPVDQRTVRSAIELDLLAELHWTDRRHLSIPAAGPVVLDDLEHDASVDVRGCMVRHVTELTPHHLGVPFDLHRSHHVENCHTITLSRPRNTVVGLIQVATGGPVERRAPVAQARWFAGPGVG